MPNALRVKPVPLLVYPYIAKLTLPQRLRRSYSRETLALRAVSPLLSTRLSALFVAPLRVFQKSNRNPIYTMGCYREQFL